jgi:copper(I)-binding protein
MRRRHLILSCVSLPFVASAHAHGVRAGELVIDHPYAVPMTAGATDGAAYLRSVKNRGVLGDRLIGATSPRAASVVLRRRVRGGATAPVQAIDFVELPPGAELRLRHDGDVQLALVGVSPPLRDGDRFPLRLRFERAGEVDVTVWVQTPRRDAGHRH